MLFPGSKKAPSREIGFRTEALAEEFLKQQGLKTISRNFRCRRGEIDLIMLDGNMLVFVEVRYRKHSRYGSGADSVNAQKQQKIIIAAQFFLQHNKMHRNRNCRFDVLSLSVSTDDGADPNGLKYQWIKNAFET